MSQKRLSERMSDTTHAIDEAQDALQAAITKAISIHFAAGIEFERQRIIELLEENMYYSAADLVLFWNDENGGYQVTLDDLIALIKGEQPWSR